MNLKRIKGDIIWLTFYIFLGFLSACGGSNNGSSNVTLHPMKEKIPHHESNHIAISSQDKFDDLKNSPHYLVSFQKYINYPSSIASKKLEAKVGSQSSLYVESIDDRLIILDGDQQILIEYDLETDITTVIAKFGHGPGDIAYPQDMIRRDKSVYIGMQDMRISKFDCSSKPCSHSSTIKLNRFSPYSIDYIDSTYIALGSVPVTGSESEAGKIAYNPVSLFNFKGKKIGSFGKTYETNGQWMLLRPFTEGKIRYNRVIESYLLVYQRLPYLYVYNSDLNLTDIFYFRDFVLGKQKYWSEIGKLNIVKEDHSLLKNIHFVENNLVLIEIETRSNMSKSSTSFIWDRKMDYYIIDLSLKKGYLLGRIDLTDESSFESLYLTKSGLLAYDSGSLYWNQF
jgi:hypothetical protein